MQRQINDHITMFVLGSRDEWLEARAGRIGGSEASAVVGLNPYMTNTELWEIKTGRKHPEDISDKPYVKYGHDAEPHLRDLFALDHPQYKVGYVDNNLFVNSRYPWAHASLDGWLLDQESRLGILEIKTTSILQSMQKEKWNNRIPDNYYLQVLHYMMVMEAHFAVLKAQLKYEYSSDVFLQVRHYRIERSEVEEDIRLLAEKERDFCNKVKGDIRPATILPEI